MANAIALSANSSVDWVFEDDPTYGETKHTGKMSRQNAFTSTVNTSLQMTKVFDTEVTLAASANTSFNFGNFTNAFGELAQSITKCKVIRIECTSGAMTAHFNSTLGFTLFGDDASDLDKSFESGEVFHQQRNTSNGYSTTNGVITFTNTSNSANCTYRFVVGGI